MIYIKQLKQQRSLCYVTKCCVFLYTGDANSVQKHNTSKWSKSLAQTFQRDFQKFPKILQISAEIVAPPNDKVQVVAHS